MIKDIQLNYRRFTKKCGMDITQSDNTCGATVGSIGLSCTPEAAKHVNAF